MTIKWALALLLLVGGCVSTPYTANRAAQQAYQDCVEINGAAACDRERETAQQREREMNNRDLNRPDFERY